MPCKHEGGRAECERYHGSLCRFVRRVNQHKAVSSTHFAGQDAGKSGAAAELFVRADLSRRGFDVTVPVSPSAEHDLHVDIPSVGWLGVQVKSVRKHKNTGTLYYNHKHRTIKSPVLALVHVPDNTLVYQAGTRPLPSELTE